MSSLSSSKKKKTPQKSPIYSVNQDVYTKSTTLRSTSPERKKRAVNFFKKHKDYVFPTYSTSQGFTSSFSVVSEFHFIVIISLIMYYIRHSI